MTAVTERSDHDLWIRFLRMLCRRFEAGSDNYLALGCLLIHEECRNPLPYPKTVRDYIDADDAAPPYLAMYGDFRLHPVTSDRTHILRGNAQAIETFKILGTHAGRILKTSPPSIAQFIPQETMNAFYDISRWIWTVFELAWQSECSSSLRDSREFCWKDADLPFASDPQLWSAPIGNLAQLPNYFFSEISNLFLASVYAIETLFYMNHTSPADDPVTMNESDVEARTASGSVILRGMHKRPIVKGRKVKPLTSGRYDLIRRLIEAGEGGMTKDEMEFTCSSARTMLKALCKRNEGWDNVIHMAKETGGGYSIT